MPRRALLAFLLACAGSAQARPAAQEADSLRAAIAAQRLRVAQADSSRDTAAAIVGRIALSARARPQERRALLQEAAALAEHAGLLPLAIEARERLAALHAGAGAHRSAHEEMRRVADLIGLRRQADSAALAAALSDSLAARRAAHAAEQELLHAEARQAHEAARTSQLMAGRWRLAAAGAGAAWAVTAVLLLIALRRQRRAGSRIAQDVESLRAHVKELAAVIDRLSALAEQRPAAVPAAPPPAPAPSAAPATAAPAGHDPLVLALFQRQAPERIATLEAARAAGDHEKMLRVLHSLRPPLDALDAEGLGALCARLRGMRPGDAGWGSGLDALIAGMRALAARA